MNLPDQNGKFGPFGGRFVPETLMPVIEELIAAYEETRQDPAFTAEFEHLLQSYVGRPSPITHAKRLSAQLGGAQIYLKREDLNHTGAHKINNALGQALLAKRLGKTRIVAETGAGQHGVGTATACALLGLECVVYMGEVDIARQQPNVYRMRLLGSAPCRQRQPHAEGRDQRGDPRLGDQRRHHPLLARLRPGAASLPDDGARLPKRHRPRSPRPDAGKLRPSP